MPFLKPSQKTNSFSALFDLHVRVPKQQCMRGLCRRPEGRVLRRRGQSGNEQKRKPRGLRQAGRPFTQKKTTQLQPEAACIRKALLMDIETVYITEAPCVVERRPVRSKALMRKEEDISKFY